MANEKVGLKSQKHAIKVMECRESLSVPHKPQRWDMDCKVHLVYFGDFQGPGTHFLHSAWEWGVGCGCGGVMGCDDEGW